MKIYLYFLTVLFAIRESASINLPFFGGCSRTKVMNDFDLDKMAPTGLTYWYLYKTSAKIQKSNITCGTFTFKKDKIRNKTKLQISATIGDVGLTISTILEKTDSPGRFKQTGLIEFNSNVQILDTDYWNYLVLETCDSYTLFSIKTAFILTALQKPTNDINQKALSILKDHKFNIDDQSIYLVDHSDCEYHAY